MPAAAVKTLLPQATLSQHRRGAFSGANVVTFLRLSATLPVFVGSDSPLQELNENH